MKRPLYLLMIIALFFLTTTPAELSALTPDQVFNKVKDSVVVVKSLSAEGIVKGIGSGVLISAGKVATNCHVLDGGASWQVGRGIQFVSAILYAQDRGKDICLLEARDITGTPVQLGAAVNLKVGSPVYTVGAPQGLELSLTDGIVSQLRGGPPPVIQTTAAISSGSSGGGLFDSEGRLVGLTTFYMKNGQNLNFAVPVELVGEVRPGQKTAVTAATGASRIEWHEQTLALEALQDWQGMIDWCREWTKNEPDNAFAWHSLGVAYYKLKRYAAAAHDFQRAVRLNPEYAEAWYGVAVAYLDQKRYIEAVEPFRQTLRIKPDFAEAWQNLGIAYFNADRYVSAVDAFRQALRIDPENAKTWMSMGYAYGLQKHYNDAIAALRRALHINPEYAQAWYVITLVYSKSGNRKAAQQALQELRRLDPKQADRVFKETGLRLP